MSIKRYNPLYKKLVRFRQPLWLENRRKVKKFNRQKWELLKKNYFVNKFKFFNQDAATYNLGKSFHDDKVLRLKKTHKYLLQDKQRLQFYFGRGRLKYFQLKLLSKKALKLSKNKDIFAASMLLYLLDNRLYNLFYRLGFVFSSMQAKKIINCDHVRVNNNSVICPTYVLKKYDMVRIDPAWVPFTKLFYLRYNFPFFYLKHKRWSCNIVSKKKLCFSNSFLINSSGCVSPFLKANLQKLLLLKQKL